MPETLVCQNCGLGTTHAFYEVGPIPVHSCRLMSTRAEALAFPTGELRLGFCSECGFIQNQRFDPDVHDYSSSYEESQAFSAHFSRFARALAQRLIDRHDLHGKTILEIGCGKGDFLVDLCELGKNRGVGIDLAYVPERTTSPAAARIEFIRDLYDERYSHLVGDLVCCRHTLEHIQPTKKFLSLIRDSLDGRPDAVVFIEVPDVLRVLREGAFWDLYYEHCSYFSTGSLARLFRACRFDLLDLATEYDDQYLLIEARVCDHQQPGQKMFEAENDLPALKETVAHFEGRIQSVLDYWRQTLRQQHQLGRRIALWGSGSKAVAFLTTLEITEEVTCVVDINRYRQGKFMPGTGHQIVAPRHLQTEPVDLIVVMNPVYVDEISDEMRRLDVAADLLAVGSDGPVDG